MMRTTVSAGMRQERMFISCYTSFCMLSALYRWISVLLLAGRAALSWAFLQRYPSW